LETTGQASDAGRKDDQMRSLLTALAVLIAGPGWLTAGAPSHAKAASHATAAAGRQGAAANSSGIVICEPVVRQADRQVADFGAGCGRWLFFTVGGRAEVGRTPLWSEVARARRELGRDDLRLTLPDAARIAPMLGLTHIAVGRMTGTARHGVLTYQLYAMPGRTPVGPALTAQGAQKQIVAALPGLAGRLTRLLGVPALPAPPPVGASPDELRRLGAVPWGPDDPLPAAQEQSFRDLAPRLPLAGLLGMKNSLRRDRPQLAAAAARLMAQAPENVLVLGQIGYVEASALVPYQAQAERLAGRFPHSYALAHAGVWLQRARHDQAQEMLLAQQMVAAAPRNPDAWLSLGATLSDAAQDIRRGRFSALLSAQEQAGLDVLYTRSLRAIQKAADLDPSYGHAWLKLATAATFQGRQELADTAFWKAQRLAPDRADVYWWGLQMFQPKWGGDPATLAKVAALAASERYPTVGQTLYVAGGLASARSQDASQALRQRAERDARAELALHPDDGDAHWDLAAALQAQRKTPEALAEFRLAAAALPGAPAVHEELARLVYDAGQWDEAMREYRKVIQLDPRDENAHFLLGWGLKHAERWDEAVQEFQTGLRLNPRDPAPHYGLGVLYEARNLPQDAIAEYEKAVSLSPDYQEANERLLLLLDQDNQLDKALAAGRRVVQSDPENGGAWDNIADVCLKRKDWAASLSASDTALKLNANDALAHENRGEALMGQGDKAAARAEWEQVLKMDQGSVAKTARDNLAAHQSERHGGPLL